MEQFALKPSLYFGPDALGVLEQLSGRKVLVVTDAFLAQSGLLERVIKRLQGCEVGVFDQVVPDPPLSLIAQGVAQFRAFRPQVLLAFGGGSPMDCAKGIRYFAQGEGCALWCVPTTAGTGSEVTSFAVLTDSASGVKYPLVDERLLPDAAVLESALLDGVPAAVTADTGMDVITHAAEAAVARRASSFSNALASAAFTMAVHSLPQARRVPGEPRERMLHASCMAGIAFNCAGLGICHGLAHALGGRFHVPHGRLNALLLPHVIRFNAQDSGAAANYAELARHCGLSGSARALAAAIQRLRDALEMPSTLSACGVKREQVTADLPQITAAALADICTAANPILPSQVQLEELVRAVL